MTQSDIWLDGYSALQARWIGARIAPSLIVLHDTAGPVAHGNAVGYLADNDRKVSAHFVVERDGSVTQMVPINRRANHAGRSSYHGRDGCNGFSIGIEIVNPGRMTRLAPRKALSWWQEKFDVDTWSIAEVETDTHGHGLWMAYTQEQIASVETLCTRLIALRPKITDIVGHWYVSPGRKVDTNPLFPIEALMARVFGREPPVEAARLALGFGPQDGLPGAMVSVDTLGGNLNMRRWPSFENNVLAAIPDETPLPVLRSVTGPGGVPTWHLVRYGGREGWIVAQYTRDLKGQ